MGSFEYYSGIKKTDPSSVANSINAADSSFNYYSKKKSNKTAPDLSTSEGLMDFARLEGLERDVQREVKPDKLSTIQRLSSALGALNPAESLIRAEEGKNILIEYPKTILEGIGSAITGNDYGNSSKRRFFSDWAELSGVDNKVMTFGVGIVGDIFLDPSTYFGGTIMRYGLKGFSTAGRTTLKGIGKVVPEAEIGLRAAGEGIKDATGGLFKFGYKTTEGLTGNYLKYKTKTSEIANGIFKTLQRKWGTGVLSEAQQEEMFIKAMTGKQAEYNFFGDVEDEMINAFNKKYPNARFPLGGKNTNNLAYEDLPDPAKGALQAQMRVKVTNDGMPIKDAIEELKGKKFTEIDYKISDIQESNPSIFTDNFTKRGSVTKGSIVIDSKGEVVDGNNRVREAFDRGETSIKAYVEIPDARFPLGGEEAVVPTVNNTVGKIIGIDEKIPTDAMAVFNKRAYQQTGVEIPEKFWKDMTPGKLVNGLDKLGVGEDVIKESAGALYDMGYRKIGDLNITENGIENMVLGAKKAVPPLSPEARAAARAGAVSRLENLNATIPAKIENLQRLRQNLAQAGMADDADLLALKQTVSELRAELGGTTKKVKKGVQQVPTQGEVDAALMDALKSEKSKYSDMILELQARLNKLDESIVVPVTKRVVQKTVKLNIEQQIADINKKILAIQNEFFDKSNILEGVLGAKTIAKERIAEAFKTGDFSKLPKDLADALRPAFDDKKVAEAFAARMERNKVIAEKGDIEDPFAIYFPSIRKDKLTKFFNSPDVAGVKLGSEGWKKEYKALLKDEELVHDPVQAFYTVESKIALNDYTEKFLKDSITEYGAPLSQFKSEQEAMKNGYRLMKSKGQFGTELGYLKERDYAFLNGQLGSNFAAVDALAKATGFDAATSLFKRFVTGPFVPFHIRNWVSGTIQNYERIGVQALLPKNIALGTRLATKVSTGVFSDITASTMVKGEDGIFRQIKRLVPLSDQKLFKTFENEVTLLGGKEYRLDDLAKVIEENFGGSTFFNHEYNSITRDAKILEGGAVFNKDQIKTWGKNFFGFKKDKNMINGIFGEQNPVFRSAKAIGGWIETSQKSQAFVAALDKGFSIDEAVKIAREAGFDYRALTPFESKIMRRIIPFYSFNRFNIGLQLNTLATNPQRINQVIRSVKNIQNLFETNLTDEEKKNLPAYIKEYLSTPVGRNDSGIPLFITNFGTPIEAFTELVRPQMEGRSTIERTFLATLSKVNPYLKVPVELAIGKDSFRQRDLKDVYDAREYRNVPEIVKNYLGLKKITKKNIETGESYDQYVADSGRLLMLRSLFTSRGFTYFNNIFNGDVTGFMRVTNAVSGIKTNPINTDIQAGYTERQRIKAIGLVLRKYGVLSEFNKLFIPKDQKK